MLLVLKGVIWDENLKQRREVRGSSARDDGKTVGGSLEKTLDGGRRRRGLLKIPNGRG